MLSISNLAIQLTTPLLLRKQRRANFSQASRGFVSDSWAFLLFPELQPVWGRQTGKMRNAVYRTATY